MDCDEELLQFVEINKAQNTVKKTRSDLNVWKRWCATNSEVRGMEDIPTSELNNLLGHFVIKIHWPVRIKTSFNGWECNMAGHCTRGLYFHSPAACENTVPPTHAISCLYHIARNVGGLTNIW